MSQAPSNDTLTQIQAESVVMLSAPDYDSEAVSEALYGEVMLVTEESEDENGEHWVKAINQSDSYAGYLPARALTDEVYEPTHRIKALRSFIYSEPDFKTAPLAGLSFFSAVGAANIEGETIEDNGFVMLNNGAWIWENHLMSPDEALDDHTASAELFLGTPYLWGGRTSLGIDCSALVQLSLMAAKHSCPRDSGDQLKATLGSDLEAAKDTPLQRGDIIFFKGHVGIMVDADNILNATARHMTTIIEPLKDVSSAYNGITGIKRI